MENIVEIDTLNDLSSWLSPKVDVTAFFEKANLQAIKHNPKNIFNDIISSNFKKNINLWLKKIIKITKLNIKNTEEILKIPKNKFFSKIKKRVNPISLIKYPKIPYFSLDIRNYNVIESKKKYPDIFLDVSLRIKLQKRTKRFYKNNKERIFFVSRLWIEMLSVTIILFFAILLFWIWLKNYVLNETITQYKKIYALKETRDLATVYAESIKIKNDFIKLKTIFTPIDFALNNKIYSNKDVKTASNVIFGGYEIWEILNISTEIYSEYTQKSKELEKTGQKIKITDFLKEKEPQIKQIHEYLSSAIIHYEQIKEIWDKISKDKFDEAIWTMKEINSNLAIFVNNYDVVLKLLWDQSPQKILILNQNRDEIRASGWFPWSVINLRIYKWQVLDYEKKDIYYYDWNLFPYKETPPEWLNKIASNYWLRDANYSILFEDSAKKLNFFYEKSWGWSIDNLVAINQWIVMDFLKKYWPIHMDSLNLDIGDKNFSLVMSALVEAKIGKKETPKDILFEFIKKFEEKLKEKWDYVWYLKIVLENLKKWEILFASRDEEIQKLINDTKMIENWKRDNWNWIYPVFTSISWNKSDRNVHRFFTISSKDVAGCEKENSFKLISTNPFEEAEEIEINKLFDTLKISKKKRWELMIIEWKWDNKQFVRIVVPKGSKLMNSDNDNKDIKIDDSNKNFTVFWFYFDTKLNSSSEIQFKYTTKITDCWNKKINFYRQPGLVNYEIKLE